MSRPGPKNELNLNPGLSRRKSSLSIRSMLKLFLVAIFLLTMYTIANFIRAIVDLNINPHKTVLQDLNVPYKPSDVAYPLVDSDQTFSVFATVWARTVARESHDARSADPDSQNELRRGGPILQESVIFSETIFRDLRLGDTVKDKHQVIDLKIPTDVFRGPELWNYDVRASFVLIPDSPSPLDHAVNYSSWIPDVVNYPAVRYWSDDHQPSLTDRIVDAFGTFAPLVDFLPINTTCQTQNSTMVEKSSAEPVPVELDSDMEDSSMDVIVEIDPLDTSRASYGTTYVSNRRLSPTKAHPHIITQSHLRVVDMVHILNRTAFEEHHKDLQRNSCGQRHVDGREDWRLCWKEYMTNGNFETRIKLREQDAQGKKRTKWAYGPYLSMFDSAWGPLDVVPVPVNREKCHGAQQDAAPSSEVAMDNLKDEKYMSVKWDVKLSVMTPAKMMLADRLAMGVSVYSAKHNLETEEGRKKVQDTLEYANALSGHKPSEDAHPRRHSSLYIISCVWLNLLYGGETSQLISLLSTRTIVSFISGVLVFHYWYTRSSTVGISIQGTALIALVLIIDLGISTKKASSSANSIFSWIFTVVVGAMPLASIPIFMLKTILRAEIYWYNSWVPWLTMSPPTHLERASSRIETRVPLIYKALAFTGLAGLFYLSNGLLLSSGTTWSTASLKDSSFTVISKALLRSGVTLGWSLQLLLNFQSKTFAGTYRPCAYINLLQSVLSVAMMLQFIVGNVPSEKGISLPVAIKMASRCVLAYQAAKYPAAGGLEDESTQ